MLVFIVEAVKGGSIHNAVTIIVFVAFIMCVANEILCINVVKIHYDIWYVSYLFVL